MIQTFEFYGSGRQINATGRFFRYEQGADGAGVTALRLSIDGNRIGTIEPGDALELPAEASRWDLEPVSSGCVGIVRIGNVRITSDKLQGVVSVVNGARAQSVAGVAFSGGTAGAAVAGQYAYIQLWNESTNKNIFLTGVSTYANALATLQLVKATTRANLSGNFIPGLRGACKKLSADFSQAGAIISGNNAVNLPWGFGTGFVLDGMSVQAGSRNELKMEAPIIIPPGLGVYVSCNVVNTIIGANFEWFEEAA